MERSYLAHAVALLGQYRQLLTDSPVLLLFLLQKQSLPIQAGFQVFTLVLGLQFLQETVR